MRRGRERHAAAFASNRHRNEHAYRSGCPHIRFAWSSSSVRSRCRRLHLPKRWKQADKGVHTLLARFTSAERSRFERNSCRCPRRAQSLKRAERVAHSSETVDGLTPRYVKCTQSREKTGTDAGIALQELREYLGLRSVLRGLRNFRTLLPLRLRMYRDWGKSTACIVQTQYSGGVLNLLLRRISGGYSTLGCLGGCRR